MFTLYFPITLPEGRGLFSTDFEYPAIRGELQLRLLPASDDIPVQTLVVSGFQTVEDAAGFVPEMQMALRIASLHLGYGIGVSGDAPVTQTKSTFDGSLPTVLPASTTALLYYTSASMSLSAHVSNVAGMVHYALAGDVPSRAKDPPLALSLQLHAESDFAGGITARFLTLMTAIEVLVDGVAGSKRNAAKQMVKF